VCPICGVGPGDLPSRWFFARQQGSPGVPPGPQPEPATRDGGFPGASGFDAGAQ
jgi:hypothetical protein